VLFNPGKVIDRATFREPQMISEGVERVFVNGVVVWRDGASTSNRPGKALRRAAGN
jgi:N-acyl-D-amino-acid deacylase